MDWQTDDVGVRYLYQSYHGLADLLHAAQLARKAQEPAALPPEKRYPDAPLEPLPARLPLRLGDPRAAFPTFRAAAGLEPPAQPLGRAQLAQLLFYSYGVHRYDVGTAVEWPVHRVVPSARCRFPVELYLWLPADSLLPAGLYHYSGLHHRLARLRAGDHGALLGQALARSLEGCAGVLLVASAFGRTASYYFDFAYRLCTQEAGIVVGNALLVAGALGLRASVGYRFMDAAVNRLLGLDGVDEAVLAAIVLQRNADVGPAPASADAAALCAQIAPIAPADPGPPPLDRERCAQLIALERRARLEQIAGPPRPLPRRHDHPVAPPALGFADPPALPRDLAEALHARSSGDSFFQPRAVPTPQPELLELLRYALEPADDDVGGGLAALRLLVVVTPSAGLTPGLYELESAATGLHLLRAGALDAELRRAQPMMRCDSAALVCYVVGAYEPLTAALGSRSYRVLQMQAGLVAQRLCALSAALGMAARCSDSYSLERVLDLLGLRESAWLPLIQVAIGHEPPGCGGAERYRLSIRF